MKRTAVFFCFFIMLGQSMFASSGSSLIEGDTQLCINAYNQIWWTFETAKSQYRSNPEAQVAVFLAEFPLVCDPNITFSVLNLPFPPDFTFLDNLVATGIPAVAQLASEIDNWGEHHVAGPFSVKQTSVNFEGTAVYSLTSRDVDFTRTPDTEGGGVVAYLSQKDVTITVRYVDLLGNRQALINNITDNVVTPLLLPPPSSPIWTTPPVTNYVTAPGSK